MISQDELSRLLHLDSEEEIANAMLYAKGAETYLTNAGCKADYDDPLFVNLLVTLTSRQLTNPDLLFSGSEIEGMAVMALVAQIRDKQQAGGL